MIKVSYSDFINRNSLLLDSMCLKECTPNHVAIKLKENNRQIIKGTVYDEKNRLSAGAIVQVAKINPVTLNRRILGFAVTDNFGNYAFSITALPGSIYELEVYAPISSR